MEIFPSIEIKDGKLVSLIRGEMSNPTIYDKTPEQVAQEFEDAGASWLQIIDLDGVDAGEKQNSDQIVSIMQSANIPALVGGGVRTLSAVEWWLDHGASRIIMGTASIIDRPFLLEACTRFPDRIVISLDGIDGCAAIRGWKEVTSFDVFELAKSFDNIGVAGIIYTDVAKSKDIRGSSIADTIEIAGSVNVPVYASGIIKTLQDLEFLNQMPDVAGAVVGYAIHEGTFTIDEALQVSRQKTTYAPSHI